MQNDQSDIFASISPIISINLVEPLSPIIKNHNNNIHDHDSQQLLSKSLPQTSNLEQNTSKSNSTNLFNKQLIDENSNSNSSNYSSSSSSLSSISNDNNINYTTHEQELTQHFFINDNPNIYVYHNKLKHKNHLFFHKQKNQNNQQQQNRCICKNENEKMYNCIQCTSNYPINVRRSKDGEETNYSLKLKQNKEKTVVNNSINNINPNNNMNSSIICRNVPLSKESSTSSSTCSSSSSSSSANQANTRLSLKPSPIPISSHLIALLTLTKPSNTFIPPPNINLANFKQAK